MGNTLNGGDLFKFVRRWDCIAASSNPMNTHSLYIKVEKFMPVYATSINEARYWKKDVLQPQAQGHHDENYMIKRRWKSFNPEKKKQIEDCTVCFAKFLLRK